MKRLRLPSLAILVLLLPFSGFAQSACTQTYGPSQGVTYDDVPEITVIVPPDVPGATNTNIMANVADATNAWNTGCNGFHGKVPPFHVSPGTGRSGTQTPENSIWVHIVHGKTPRNPAGGLVLAQWEPLPPPPAVNDIVLYDTLDDGTPNGAPIVWSSSAVVNYITHEFGHALGLDHDFCASGGIMVPGTGITSGTILPDYCTAVEQVQSPVCNSGNKLLGSVGPCPPGCECQRGEGFGALDPIGGLQPCDFLGQLCPGDSPFPWYQGFPTVVCETTCRETAAGATCDVNCRTVYTYATTTDGGVDLGNDGDGIAAVDASTRMAANGAYDGSGPNVILSSIAEGQTVSRTMTIAGSAVSPNRVASMAVWIDNQHIDLPDLALHLPSTDSCVHPNGQSDPDCPNIGFSATFDTTTLPDGPHVLQIIVIDALPNQPYPTMLQRNFTIFNRCNDATIAPVTITSPAANSIAAPATTVTASATASTAITQVQFYVDGVATVLDTVPPYSFAWDTTHVANGTHSLTARGYDLCGNSRLSAALPVQVANDVTPPAVALTAPAANALLSSNAVFSSTSSDNVGVKRVDYYVDSTFLGGNANAPFSLNANVSGIADGRHNATARAWDAAGNFANSAAVSVIVDNTAPPLSIDQPAANATVSGAAVALTGWATDLSSITSLAFKVDGQPLTLTAPYTYGLSRADVCNVYPSDPHCPNVGWRATFDSTRLTAGSHVFTVTATNGVNLTTSLQRTLVVNNDATIPTISFTAPAYGAVVAGTVSVTGNAADNVAVTRVELSVDGTLYATDTTAPYAFSWNTAGYAEGAHTLTLNAFDAAGNSATATSSATVDNLRPLLRLVSGDGITLTNGSSYGLPSTTAGVPVSRAITIYNDGSDTLTIANPSALVSGNGFSQLDLPASTVAPQSSTVFRVRLSSFTAGNYNGTVSIQTNAGTVTFSVYGTVTPAAAPVVRVVSGDNITVASGGTYAFPSTAAGTPVSRAFTIYNDGNATLTLSNPSALVSGTGFSQIDVAPPSSIAPGATGVFRVRLLSSTRGTYSGTVSIQSNAAPFPFTVTGTVQ